MEEPASRKGWRAFFCNPAGCTYLEAWNKPRTGYSSMQRMHEYIYMMHGMNVSWILRVPITSVSQLIKAARDRRSQTEFARELGISQPTLCRYEQGGANPKAEVIERCMRLVHWGEQESVPSVDELAEKVRAQLGREDQAPLRVALSKLIDGLAAE